MTHESLYAPPTIRTPDLLEDIQKFVDPNASTEMFARLPEHAKRKVTVVVERMEFIDHLHVVSVNLLKRRRDDVTCREREDGSIVEVVNFHMSLWNHDFAGFDFDVEALSIYLYLTCVDTIQGQEEHVNPFKWLKRRIGESGDVSVSSLDVLREEYFNDHGLSKRFVAAFVHDLNGSKIESRLCEELVVAKLRDRRVEPTSLAAWEKRTSNDKIKKIARHLYEVRSKFTHSSFRSFVPNVPVERAIGHSGDVLMARDRDGLLDLLRAVVIFLTRSLMSRDCELAIANKAEC